MTSKQANFANYVCSSKELVLKALQLGHQLDGQMSKPFYEALAEVQACVRHLNSAMDRLKPAIDAEIISELEIDS